MNNMKQAVVIGVEGQDGKLLYDLLVKMEYSVVGIARNQVQSSNETRFDPIDILRFDQVSKLIEKLQPSEVYYLAAFHDASENLSDDNIELLGNSYQVNIAGLANFLEAIRTFSSQTRLFYAASSHIFGEPEEKVQNENTPIRPDGIYGITKAAGLALCQFYRSEFGIYAAVGILYNHESELRANSFLSQKIIKGAVGIKWGKQEKLVLGNLHAIVDWGYASDYVRAMQLILNAKFADDYVIATGEPHTVLDFVQTAFGYLGLDWSLYVEEDQRIVRKPSFYRVGDSSKLKKKTGWKPSVSFERMVELLLTHEEIECNVYED